VVLVLVLVLLSVLLGPSEGVVVVEEELCV